MHEPDESTPETTATSDALDALGRAAATESPQPGIIPRPAAVPHRRGQGRGWWVATAAMVLVVVAVGVLVLRDDDTVEQFAGPPSTSLPGPVATDDDLAVEFDPPTTGDEVDCTPVEFAAIANVLGVDSVAADAGISAERCAVVAAPWTVTYELIDAPEPLGSSGATPLDVGDEGYLDTTTDRSGHWSARGAVRVGDRAVILTVASDATGADTYPPSESPAVEPLVRDRATTLLGVLAARL